MGNGDLSAYHPSQGADPATDEKRDLALDYNAVIEGISKPNSVAAEFDTKEKVVAAMRDVIKADLGLSINLSTSIEQAHECCRETGLKRHSVEYSLGFLDRHNHLANSQVLEISTMCGHGLVSNNLAEKMIADVKENRRTPEEAAAYLACFCPCGVYNPARAKRLLEEARTRQR
jgi:hypothetical protein